MKVERSGPVRGQREEKSFCRICPGMCGLVLTIDESQRIVEVRGDKAHPISRGYACVKALQAPEAYHGPARLLHPLKRTPDGTFERISIERALDEIGAKLGSLLAEDGPESIGVYRGLGSAFMAPVYQMHYDWLRAIGSRAMFSNSTIDQSSKWVTAERLGSWDAGRHHFYDSTVMMLVGTNPLVCVGPSGFERGNVNKAMREAKARGMKFICVDPRLTETARHADVFLQVRPGEDPSLAAGMLRMILAEGWEDREFCGAYVDQLEELRQAVAPFTPDYVEQRAGITAAALRAAVELFAHIHRRGPVLGSTGISMGPRSNLSEHLYECLNVVCGRYQRPGDRIWNPGVFQRPRHRRAEVIPPSRPWEHGHKSRIRGTGMIHDQMMTSILPDEILVPGKGQIKALIVDGGGPATAWPDQRKAVKALRSLELLVTIDPYFTNTAGLSHYVLPPKMQFEMPNISNCNLSYEPRVVTKAFQQYARPLIPTPEGSELVDDWYVFWALAGRLGRTIVFAGHQLDMHVAPTTDDLLAIVTRNGAVPLAEVKTYPSGKIFDIEQYVEPRRSTANARFQVMPPDVAAQLAEVAAEPVNIGSAGGDGRIFTHRLTVRRMREVMNGIGQNLQGIRRRVPFNPAHLHPDDLTLFGIKEGDRIGIVSGHGSIRAIAQADETVQPGVVAMTHAWGGLPDEDGDYETFGACTNRLISNDDPYETENAMVRMTAIPVNIVRL